MGSARECDGLFTGELRRSALPSPLLQEPDKELFMRQFSELRIIAYYSDVRKQLRSLPNGQGLAPLTRVEREMLMKARGAGRSGGLPTSAL